MLPESGFGEEARGPCALESRGLAEMVLAGEGRWETESYSLLTDATGRGGNSLELVSPPPVSARYPR